jgi:hypothetical protein
MSKADGADGAWEQGEFAGIHDRIRSMAVAMADARVDSVRVTFCRGGSAHVSMEYTLFPEEGMATEGDAPSLPRAPRKLQAVC